MSNLVTVKALTQSGMVQEFRCQEILEIDGKPFVSPEQAELDMEAVQGMLMSLEGRIITLENILGRSLPNGSYP